MSWRKVQSMKRSLALTALIGLTITGCGPAEAGDSTMLACDEFAAYAKNGQPQDTRAETVDSIGAVIGNADPKLQDAYDGLTRAVDAPESTWTAAADVFAQTCFDLGWEG